MAAGTSTYKGLAMPLSGEATMTQLTAATDILTLKGAGSQSGDFLVGTGSTGTEYFYITSAGKAVFVGGVGTKDNGTAAPTTATMVVNGDMMLANPGTVRLYIRQNGTVYFIDIDG